MIVNEGAMHNNTPKVVVRGEEGGRDGDEATFIGKGGGLQALKYRQRLHKSASSAVNVFGCRREAEDGYTF